MRKVLVSNLVDEKIESLEYYMLDVLKLSEEAALKRSQRMRTFIHELALPADYSLCRFKQWRSLGYRCAVFEKDWVFAYEIFSNGIIVRDMSHTTMLN